MSNKILISALGATAFCPGGYRNRFVAAIGSNDHIQCEAFCKVQLMEKRPRAEGSDSDLFVVTQAGAKTVFNSFMQSKIDDLIADRVHDMVNEIASERVSPNSMEHEPLCEHLQESPGVSSMVMSLLLRDLFELSIDLQTRLTDATAKATEWMPDDMGGSFAAGYQADLDACNATLERAQSRTGQGHS